MARILIVDDNTEMRRVLCQIVQLAGHQVDEADTGRAGLEMFRVIRHDLVLTDIVMPDMDGNQAIVEIRRLVPEAKIIAMSGGGRSRNMSLLRIATDFGATRVLEKPFRKAEVLRMVDEVLAGEGGSPRDAATG